MDLQIDDKQAGERVSPAKVVSGGTAPAESDALYEARKQIYPQSVSGTFRRIKWAILVVTLGIYYILPFVRWDRGPDAPSQAVLVDLEHNRFYFFFIEIWPQEVYYITGLMILAALGLFLMNALAGRVWCGYLCPQTVWTDLYLMIERLAEGDRRERMRKDAGPWTIQRVAEKTVKHSLWLAIAWWTGGAWVLYFNDAPTLVRQLATFSAPAIAYIWIGILTATTYVLAGFMREQVCLYMCPWPRIQAALTDENALNVTYRYDRGEQRMSVKKAKATRALGGQAGDCIDCGQCVAVCPTGVDIRGGAEHGLHPVRPVHRRLRQRDAQDRTARAPDRLRHRRQHPAAAGRQGERLQAGAREDGALHGADRRHRRLDGGQAGDARRRRACRHPRS